MDVFCAVGHFDGGAVELGVDGACVIDDDDGEAHNCAATRTVADLRFDGDVRGLLSNVEVAGVDIDALAFEAVIERKRLVDFPGHVQPNGAVDAAMIGVEVVNVPLEGRVGGALSVSGAVVEFDRQHVLLATELYLVRDVDAVGTDPVFRKANLLAVEKNIARLTHAFEFEEEIAPREASWKFEVLPIPWDSLVRATVASAVRDDGAERVDIVEAVRRRDGRPLRVVKGCGLGIVHVITEKPPIEIEVDRGTRGFRGKVR